MMNQFASVLVLVLVLGFSCPVTGIWATGKSTGDRGRVRMHHRQQRSTLEARDSLWEFCTSPCANEVCAEEKVANARDQLVKCARNPIYCQTVSTLIHQVNAAAMTKGPVEQCNGLHSWEPLPPRRYEWHRDGIPWDYLWKWFTGESQ